MADDVTYSQKKIERHIAPKLRKKTKVKSVISGETLKRRRGEHPYGSKSPTQPGVVRDTAKLHDKAQSRPLGKSRPEYVGTKGNPCMTIKR